MTDMEVDLLIEETSKLKDSVKDCPFCGGKARFVITNSVGAGCCDIRCFTCHVSSNLAGANEVLENWNRRDG